MLIGDSNFEDILCQVDGNDFRLRGWTASVAWEVEGLQSYFGTLMPEQRVRGESILSIEQTSLTYGSLRRTLAHYPACRAIARPA